MTQPDPNTAVALEAIAEGLDILHLLACATNNTKWVNDSMSLDKLNELARSLGYDDAQSVHTQVESDRQDKMNNRFLDIYKCYTKVGQLRRELTDTKRVAQLWFRKAMERKKELVHARTEAARLVTPNLALLLIGMANIIENYDYPKTAREAREFAARIREVLDDSQA